MFQSPKNRLSQEREHSNLNKLLQTRRKFIIDRLIQQEDKSRSQVSLYHTFSAALPLRKVSPVAAAVYLDRLPSPQSKKQSTRTNWLPNHKRPSESMMRNNLVIARTMNIKPAVLFS